MPASASDSVDCKAVARLVAACKRAVSEVHAAWLRRCDAEQRGRHRRAPTATPLHDEASHEWTDAAMLCDSRCLFADHQCTVAVAGAVGDRFVARGRNDGVQAMSCSPVPRSDSATASSVTRGARQRRWQRVHAA
jgi:hypothetical protein